MCKSELASKPSVTVPTGDAIDLPLRAGKSMEFSNPRRAVGWKKAVFLLAAGLFFILGALGALLPGLPATPFLLLCSYFLIRSSPRLNARLLRSKLFGAILTDWQRRGGVRRNIKVKAVFAVAVAVGLTVFLSGRSVPVSVATIALAGIGIVVIVRLPTLD